MIWFCTVCSIMSNLLIFLSDKNSSSYFFFYYQTAELGQVVDMFFPVCCLAVNYLFTLLPLFASSFISCIQPTLLPYIVKGWREKWQPTPVFLSGKSHGQRNLLGYSPWFHKESNTTQQLNSNNKKNPKAGNVLDRFHGQ